jgi:hypothetical protein
VRGARGNSRPYRDRREFITLLGGAGIAWPLAVRAQRSGEMRRIGVLTAFAESDDEAPRYAASLRCRLMASKHTGRRRRPTPEITSSVLDSIRGVRHVATHNDILRCNMGAFDA